MDVFRTLHHVVMCFFPLHHHLLTSSIAAVSRTLGQYVYMKAALKRWCSSDKALANSLSPTLKGRRHQRRVHRAFYRPEARCEENDYEYPKVEAVEVNPPLPKN
ncbi:hypothetical protein C8J57DRAFT_1470742 [Mycena rebaudengoi]|nr:hypothetical protein C8J57DRAFT_1470742 [Mycena rebaudengoi]